MAKVKIICNCHENLDDVKEDLAKAFQTTAETKDKFADPLMEDLYGECDAWFNYYSEIMTNEIIEELKKE